MNRRLGECSNCRMPNFSAAAKNGRSSSAASSPSLTSHIRVEAVRKIGIKHGPTIAVEHLSDEEVRAYRLLDNRLAELGTWDKTTLRTERLSLSALDPDFSLEITGWDHAELDVILRHDRRLADDA